MLTMKVEGSKLASERDARQLKDDTDDKSSK